MQINWFTVIAQLINFLILVWLLKRFLYRPILNAIDAREKRIAETLQQAAATQQQATTEQEKFQALNTDLEARRANLMQEATAAADEEGQKLMGEARVAADALCENRRQEQLREVQKLRQEIQNVTTREVFALTRKILTGLASTTLEQSMVAMFCEQLQEMPDEIRSQLITVLTSEPPGGTLRSSLPLDAEQQQQLQACIDTWAGNPVPLQFETSENLVCGVELCAKGLHTSWSIDANLDQLEKALTSSLGKNSHASSFTTGAELANE